MSSPIPSHVHQAMQAAQDRLRLGRLYITLTLNESGPTWEYRPHCRWLVLRTDEPGAALAGIVAALLARSAYLGKGPVTNIPPRLMKRYQGMQAMLLSAIEQQSDRGTSCANLPAKENDHD